MKTEPILRGRASGRLTNEDLQRLVREGSPDLIEMAIEEFNIPIKKILKIAIE